MHSAKSARNIVIASILGSILFAAGIGVFIFWYEGNEEDAARTASDSLAVALVEGKKGKAPDGAGDYVKPIRKWFGPIKAAKTVDVRQVDNYSNTSNQRNGRSWWTSTIFMRTERGAALLLVTYADSTDPKDAKVEGIRELSPKKVAEGALTKQELRDAKAGAGSRKELASDIMLSDTFFQESAASRRKKKPPPVPQVSEEELERQRAQRQQHLKCIQDAAGDVDKMVKCR